MAIDHSSRLFKRLKRHNVFPHLVAEDLANGVEHTPVDRLKLQQMLPGFPDPVSTIIVTGRPPNQQDLNNVIGSDPQSAPFTVDRSYQYKAPDNAAKATTPSKLEIKQFPLNLSSAIGVPYVLFKIFKSERGPVESTDATTISLVQGANRAASVIAGIPLATAATAAVFGGQVAGSTGAIAAAIATTESGQGAINNVASQIFGSEVNITSQAKNLVKNFALKRNIQQLEEAIALFMPDGITSNYDHEYDVLSVTATLGVAGFAAQAAGSDGFVGDANPYIAEAAATLASKVIGGEDFAKLGLFATTGLVRNPQMELIYSTPVLRKFTFDFRLIPRDSNEAAAIIKIIDDFKFFSAPEILTGTGGRYLIPPSQFQIEFYKGDGTINDKLFKTKNCVLTGVSVDYTPNGFATFADGMPVEIRMQLNFQETSIISKSDIYSTTSFTTDINSGNPVPIKMGY